MIYVYIVYKYIYIYIYHKYIVYMYILFFCGVGLLNGWHGLSWLDSNQANQMASYGS